MPDTWMTVAEAAANLKVHTRTIERRIASGKIQARRADDGLLQVLINLPDAPESAPDTAIEAVRELAADQVTLATGSASALVNFARNEAQRAHEELTIVRQDAGRARRSALVAWCVVALLGVGATIAVGWTASKITRANADVRRLTDYADKIEAESQRLLAERDTARQDAQAARLAGAEASGKLAAYVEQHQHLLEIQAKGPTTRPNSLLQRLATALSEP